MTDDRALREARWEVCDLNEAIAWGVHDRSSDIRISVFGREAAELLVEQLNYYEDSRNRHAAALTAARAHGAQEAYERAAKECDERKAFYDELAQQAYAEAEDDAESEGTPPDTTDGEFYEEKAGACFQLAAAIRALAAEEQRT